MCIVLCIMCVVLIGDVQVLMGNRASHITGMVQVPNLDLKTWKLVVPRRTYASLSTSV